eukprot:365535-Chlamydomonas_euryale.AAC.49
MHLNFGLMCGCGHWMHRIQASIPKLVGLPGKSLCAALNLYPAPRASTLRSCMAYLQGHNSMVNLIPWNPVHSPDGPKFAAPTDDAIAVFSRILKYQYGISCTVRAEKGQDISGACGQLVIEAQDGHNSCSSAVARPAAKPVRDIEELA